MRDYGKVQTVFWTSEDIQGLSDSSKLLALYLLSGPHTNQIGCFRLPDGYVADDLNWSAETVAKGFRDLSAKGFATRDEASKWVVIHKFTKWNEIENPNQAKAAAKLFDQVPDGSPVKPILARALRDYAPRFPEDVRLPFETLSEPFRNQEQEQEQEQEQKQEQESVPGFALVAGAPPSSPKPAKTRAGKSAKAPKTPMPDCFGISERVRRWAAEKGHANLEAHFESFQSKCRANGYQYVDWDDAFMNAVRDDWAKLNGRAQGFGAPRRVGGHDSDAENAKAKAMLFGSNYQGEVIDV